MEDLPPLKNIPPNLKDDLAKIYPEASEDDLNRYVELIVTYDTEKLPPTKEAREYKRLSKEIKELSERHEELKKTVLQQYKTLGHQLGDVKIIEAGGKDYNLPELYSWIESNLSAEDLEYVTVKQIDEKKFTRLILEGKVSSRDLPENIFIEKKKSYRVELDDARQRKKKD